MRFAPQERAARRSSRVRMPPAAFTPTEAGQEARINLTACSVAPPAEYVPSARLTNPNPVDVFTKATPQFEQISHSFLTWPSSRKSISKITLSRAPRPITVSLIVLISAATSSHSSPSTLPSVTTESISVAPSSTARAASAALIETAALPCGKEFTAQTAVPLPESIFRAAATA